MAKADQFPALYAALRAIFVPYLDRLTVQTDAPGVICLNAPKSPWPDKELFFGKAEIGKRYVSFHLMPVYMHPDLLDGVSPALRKRMQGKSCFNFTQADPALVAELADLTAASVARMAADGYVV
jgi:hypothetical protein